MKVKLVLLFTIVAFYIIFKYDVVLTSQTQITCTESNEIVYCKRKIVNYGIDIGNKNLEGKGL